MYEKFNLKESARLVRHYITNMVDREYDNLPYWLLLPNKKPAEAAHCRVDDAELVGSWYEGLCCCMDILGDGEGEDVKQSLRRHLMKSWGEHGLRFCEKYPWTHTVHSSFHEMGYILPAMNLITEEYPDDELAEKRTAELIKGMRELVTERKVRTFWSGDSEETEPVYEFPNDVYLKYGGFVVRRYELKGDETALDLAKGLTNYVLGVSRYFNYKMEFFGHVHSAVWFAAGIVKLGRLTNEARYIEKGKGIFDYALSLSSSFGWLPEYAQWHPIEEEHCETCCIKDMIVCADELIKAGYNEYWSVMNSFARNQLMENQVKYTGYVVCDNSLPDSGGITYRNIDKRMIGGFTGGSEPNSISLTRFRSIAGCCVGTAPVALKTVWDNALTEQNGILTVNIPCDKETGSYVLRSEIPNEGKITLTVKNACKAGFRLYDWVNAPSFYLNGEKTAAVTENGVAFAEVKPGDVLEMRFEISSQSHKEKVRGVDFTVYTRACDVIKLSPEGDHIRLYQRDLSVPKFYPAPEDVQYLGAANYGPTQMKK